MYSSIMIPVICSFILGYADAVTKVVPVNSPILDAGNIMVWSACLCLIIVWPAAIVSHTSLKCAIRGNGPLTWQSFCRVSA